MMVDKPPLMFTKKMLPWSFQRYLYKLMLFENSCACLCALISLMFTFGSHIRTKKITSAFVKVKIVAQKCIYLCYYNLWVFSCDIRIH